MQCDVTRCIICISNQVKYLDKDKEHSYKNFTNERSYFVNLSYLSNAIKKMLDKISFHRHFKFFIKYNKKIAD